ncbi:MAG: TIGR04076 family protein [Candidatus Hadarchaeum sp.]
MADLHIVDTASLAWAPHRTCAGVYTQSLVDQKISQDLEVKLVRIAPGAEISPHVHEHSAETFYVLSGEGAFYVGDRLVPCRAGSCAHAKPGVVHGLKNTGQEDLQLLAVFTPPLVYAEARTHEPYRVIVTVRAVNGHCKFGHQVGDQVIFDGETVNGRICMSALYSFLPKVFAMRYGADFPWLDAEHKDVATHACPDAHNPVVFEIRRVKEL